MMQNHQTIQGLVGVGQWAIISGTLLYLTSGPPIIPCHISPSASAAVINGFVFYSLFSLIIYHPSVPIRINVGLSELVHLLCELFIHKTYTLNIPRHQFVGEHKMSSFCNLS